MPVVLGNDEDLRFCKWCKGKIPSDNDTDYCSEKCKFDAMERKMDFEKKKKTEGYPS